MNEKIQGEIDQLMRKNGNVRGDVLKDHFLYIKEKLGEEGVQKMEEFLAESGYPLKFSEIKELEWYKDAFCALIMLLLKEFFNWKEENFVKMGERVTKYSFIVTRVMLMYFVSVEKLLKEAPKIWYKHVDFGKLEVLEFNKEKRCIRIKIEDYDMHPLTCFYQRGYYKGLFDYVIKGKNVSVEEESCIYRGDPFHVYRITWR